MPYEVDQSGKVEQTGQNTVLAMVNGKSVTVLLTARDKRSLQKMFRAVKKARAFPHVVFGVCLYLLLTESGTRSRVVIDREYCGKEMSIRNVVVQCLLRDGKSPDRFSIEFGHVGKLSRSHSVAYKVAAGKLKPTLQLHLRDIQNYLSKNIKTGSLR